MSPGTRCGMVYLVRRACVLILVYHPLIPPYTPIVPECLGRSVWQVLSVGEGCPPSDLSRGCLPVSLAIRRCVSWVVRPWSGCPPISSVLWGRVRLATSVCLSVSGCLSCHLSGSLPVLVTWSLPCTCCGSFPSVSRSYTPLVYR